MITDFENANLLQPLSQTVRERTGLCVSPQAWDKLYGAIQSRMKKARAPGAEQYSALLASDTGESRKEWRELVKLLTTGETFFFRDKGQFSLLRFQILPRLIECKKAVRSLRLWSAGCATGEEPYSLAILLRELLPDFEEWDILILGTDINEEYLEKARRGIYGPYSFRGTPEELRRKYFKKRGEGWEIDGKFRAAVRFREGNLTGGRFPDDSSEVHGMDLVLCRNVFIYLDPRSAAAIVDKFADALGDGGFLMLGHTEMAGVKQDRFRAKIFPESVVYEKLSRREPLPPAALTLPPEPAPIEPEAMPPVAADAVPEPEKPDWKSELDEGEALFNQGKYVPALLKAGRIAEAVPGHFQAHFLQARALANMGKYGEAGESCRRALAINGLEPRPYRLLSHIAQVQGNFALAREMLEKAIYLAPSSVADYLELGSLVEREGELAKARKLWRAALGILEGLPPGAPLEPFAMSAGEVLDHVRKMLEFQCNV
ncbi:MAG: tetratricopeptide repeat protein [Nitrospinae bacterium]|nr:tetratricopeptide repeat protein [Nitrospinota bacterium]